MERLVDFTNKTCDCFEWQDNDAPCRHAIAAAPMMHGREMTINPEKWFKHGWSPIYLTEEYIKAVEGIDVIPPRMDDLPPDGITGPPAYIRSAGRPALKRIRSAADANGNSKRTGKPLKKHKCSRCQRYGHHAQRCPEDVIVIE